MRSATLGSGRSVHRPDDVACECTERGSCNVSHFAFRIDRMTHPVAKLSDLPPDGLFPVSLADGTPVCLVRHEGQVYALHDQCTHAEYSLSAGELQPDGTVQCLWHGA